MLKAKNNAKIAMLKAKKIAMLKTKIAILKMILDLIRIASVSVKFSVGCLIFFFIYFKIKYIFQNIKMNIKIACAGPGERIGQTYPSA